MHFTGQQIFEGTLLGLGPVSVLFPELWGSVVQQQLGLPTLTPAQQSQRVEYVGGVEAAIEAAKPGFFTQFRTEMTSGDPVQVDDAIDAVSKVTLAVMQQRNDANWQAAQKKLASLQTDRAAQGGTYLYNTSATATQTVNILYGYAAAALVIYLAVAIIFVVVVPVPLVRGKTSIEQTFSHDKVVALFAERLYTAP
ncbi:MAG: hypothetical protein JO101_08040, partial [Candidatus Eremiobacteraeota bacterium]|nr:hypothetical protein [Candidatus Eremiobacteraeota bacterium]MBV8355253.1 hypothetical protein [Candidatus Eremiobacteraeota bacterium]